MPFFNPPKIRTLKHFPLMKFSRDEPRILYYEGSKDYEFPIWLNYQIDTPPQKGVYLYGIRPRHPETLNYAGHFEYDYDSDFLVAGSFYYESLPLFLELSNPEISDLIMDVSPSFYLKQTNLPFRTTLIDGIYIGSDHYIFLISVAIGIVGIGLFLFILKRLKMIKISRKN